MEILKGSKLCFGGMLKESEDISFYILSS